MKLKIFFFFLSLFLSFAIFAKPQNENFGSSLFAVPDIGMQFDDAFLPSDENGEVSGEYEESVGGRIFGIGFLFFISFVLGIMLLVLCLIIFFKWKKFGSAPKIIISGCSILLLILFLLSLAGASLALYYFLGEKQASSDKSSQETDKSAEEFAAAEGISVSPSLNGQADEAEIAKFAFAKFNNAIKLYQDYQKNYDSDIYQQALSEIELALEADNENPAYWLFAGKMYSEVAPDYAMQVAAETYLRKSLELDPKNLQTILTLANCLSLQERYHEANELFTKALSRDYNALRDYLVPIIAYTYIYDHQYEKAEKFLRNLLESDPGADALRISLAITLNMQGQAMAEDAKNELRKVIGRPDSPQLLKTYASNLLNNFDKWHDRRNQ